MSNGLLLFVALLVTASGMFCFALSIDAHWRQVVGSLPPSWPTRLGLRLVGSLSLAFGFLIYAAADPLLMAVFVWTMMLTVAAAIVAAGITVHSRLVSPPTVE